MNPLTYIAIGVSLAAPVGPASVEAVRRGLLHGFAPAFLFGLGVAAGDAVYMLVVYCGLAGFIEIPAVRAGVWSLGAVVLLYFGALAVRDCYRGVRLGDGAPLPDRSPHVAGFLVTVSNPLAVVWWLGVYGAMAASALGQARLSPLAGGLWVIFGVLAWFSALALLLHWGRRFVNDSSMRYVSAVAGVVLVGFGLYFGFVALEALASLGGDASRPFHLI